MNSSTIRAYVKLARARAKQKDEEGKRQALAEARSTWGALPSFARRHEWPWYLAALTASIWL